MTDIQCFKIGWNNKPLRPLDAANFSSISSNGSSHNIVLNGSQFSFHKTDSARGKNIQKQLQINQSERPPQTLRQDLLRLQKEQLIDLLMDEIIENKNHRKKQQNQLNSLKIVNSGKFRMCENQDQDWIKKYEQLAMYMQEYIRNTNQANIQFIQIISKLKSQNQQLIKKQEQTSKIQCANCKYIQQIFKETQTDNKQKLINLEKSLQHYMDINNSISSKYEKLKILYEKLNKEMEIANENIKNLTQELNGNISISQYSYSQSKTIRVDGSHSKDYSEPISSISPFSIRDKQNCKTITKQKHLNEQKSEKIKLLRIQNSQLRQCNEKMQIQLEAKSQKIRKLLADVQKLSEQKWKYKEFYLQRTICIEHPQ